MNEKGRFLATLHSLGGTASSQQLRTRLGLGRIEYARLLNELNQDGLVGIGSGDSGTISLVSASQGLLPFELVPPADATTPRRRDADTVKKPKFMYFCNFSTGSENLREFSFTTRRGGDDGNIHAPSFILLHDLNRAVHLGKIRRTRKVATFGTALDLYDVRPVNLGDELPTRWVSTGRVALPSVPGEVTDLSGLFEVIQTDLLRLNPDLTEDYFSFHTYSSDSDVPVQFGDAVASGFRIFRRTAPLNGYYKGVQEQEIYDLDIQSFIDGPVQYDAHGRCEYVHGDRRLVIHKVDRKKLERCIGIDLVYNYIDEKRCVFVQYKCQRKNGDPYYFKSDKSLARQTECMKHIPDLGKCPNITRSLGELRLCACSAFVKLCRREVHLHHNVPRGAYYALCIWEKMRTTRESMDVDVRPHLTNDIFSECVRGGNIGTSPQQTDFLHEWLNRTGEDERVRLIFDEELIG